MSIESGLQAILDAVGVHLDEDSFNNVMAFLPLSRVSMFQKVVIGAALGVVAAIIRKWMEERRRETVAASQAAVAQ